MFFTLAGNRRRIEDAAAKAWAEGFAIGWQEGLAIGRAEARQESVAIGRTEGRRQIRQEMAEWYAAAVKWYKAVNADLAAGRRNPGAGLDPGPPPILSENGGNPPH